jgi:hypothetical protein
MSEQSFRATPLTEGERVLASWAPADAHILEGGAR